ncbi:MAG: hypothetical protein ABSD85_15600 [Acidimicrobiales bacterium]|jgi:hypothetical protein
MEHLVSYLDAIDERLWEHLDDDDELKLKSDYLDSLLGNAQCARA